MEGDITMKKHMLLICVLVIATLATILVIIQTQTTKKSNEIRIGVLTSSTGESARYGQGVLNGIQMAVEEINSRGGVAGKRVRLIVEDDASDTSRAVSAFRKLASVDNVPVIIGPISSSAAMACSPVANELKVVLFSPSAATPAFSSPSDYTFRNRVSSQHEISELARTAYQQLGLRRIGILFVNNDYGLGNKTSFEQAFSKRGGTVPIAEAFDEGTTDVRSQLAKIKDRSPDGIFLVGQGTEGGYALRQARELGIKTRLLSTITIQRDDVLRIARDAANGVIFALPAYDPGASKVTDDFDKKYKQQSGQGSDMFSGNGYDAMYIMARAIEQGGYTADGIKTALFCIRNFPGVSGSTSFDKNGDVTKPVSIKVIEGGQFIYIEQTTKPAQ